jgi:hypothetical protein
VTLLHLLYQKNKENNVVLNVNKKEECNARRIQKAMRLSAFALANGRGALGSKKLAEPELEQERMRERGLDTD